MNYSAYDRWRLGLDEPDDDDVFDDCPYCEGEGCTECDGTGEYSPPAEPDDLDDGDWPDLHPLWSPN